MIIHDLLRKHPLVHAFTQKNAVFAHLSIIQEALLCIGALKNQTKPLVIVKENEYKASELLRAIRNIDETVDIVYYNHEESLRVEAIVESEIMRSDRINALYKIIRHDYDLCITHANAVIRKISRPEILAAACLELRTGEMIVDDFILCLRRMGYRRVKSVEKPFTYAKRGGIIDVFSAQMTQPLRIELFDTMIDSLRYFDVDSQRSVTQTTQAEIVFASEVLLSEEELTVIDETVRARLASSGANSELIYEMEQKLDLLNNHLYDASLYAMLGFWKTHASFFSYVGNALCLISPLEAVQRNVDFAHEEAVEFIQEQNEANQLLLNYDVYGSLAALLAQHQPLTIFEYQHEDELHVPWHSAQVVSEDLGQTLQFLTKQAITQRVIVVLDEKNMDLIIAKMLEHQIPYRILADDIPGNGITLWYGPLQEGFILEDLKLAVYTENELFNPTHKVYKYDNKFLGAETLNQFQDLDIADYVVHRQYGIGRYMGIETKEIEGIKKDFLCIVYRDDDKLFVPLEQFHLVRKYISSEAASIRLSKIGSNTWKKNQERIKDNVADIADRLVRLYAQRKESPGFAFSPDSEYQLQFESEFAFELTADQKVAIAEIKSDMERSLPMDRLLCGDVGFGKTEVAIRAAFKAIADQKQVVFLCPTTILSAQHGRTIEQRFANYPISVAVLNRFVSEKKQKEILRRVKEGKVDLLIGTHRVLSKDVVMHDLGLLIIDEEQRFGVEHKERIKELKVSVDVLSLSATPIPRTLQMSLVGLRSLSQLNTPPSNRLPVRTYVIEKNEKTLHDIIRKEINRDGQVFYLFNDIERIYGVAAMIQTSIPDAKVAVIHGRLDRDDIEDVMIQYIQKTFNVLVCTTIIETGIDIPNANTIIVDNAHRFGLSQLYQIKGRVGRSDRLAYAYFVVPSKQNLTEVAQKRLLAIKEFTQLGSGYKIALRDLTIRGAGEILGGNQSGFIDTVGIDLYIQLLKEAIAQRKGETAQTEEKPSYNLKIEGYLPQSFTADEGEKLELYQQINDIDSFSQLKGFHEMIVDRYGVLPQAVEMLLEKKRLELFLRDPRILSFKERIRRIELAFTPQYSDSVDGMHLFELVSERTSEIKIKYIRQSIIFFVPIYDEWMEDLLFILDNIKERHDEDR